MVGGLNGGGGDVEGVYTYMDGDDMDSIEAIEALGGDPGFWTPPKEEEEEEKEGGGGGGEKEKEVVAIPKFMKDVEGGEWKATDGLGPKPEKVGEFEKMEEGWEWDGVEDEGAYFD